MPISENINILIIKSLFSEENLLTEYLKPHGYKITMCTSIIKALDLLHLNDYDTVILDDTGVLREDFINFNNLENFLLSNNIKSIKLN